MASRINVVLAPPLRINEEGGGDGFDADALSDDVSDTAWDTDA